MIVPENGLNTSSRSGRAGSQYAFYEGDACSIADELSNVPAEELSDRAIVEILSYNNYPKQDHHIISALIFDKLLKALHIGETMGSRYWKAFLDKGNSEEMLLIFVCIYKILLKIDEKLRTPLLNALTGLVEKVRLYSVWNRISAEMSILTTEFLPEILRLIFNEISVPADYDNRIVEEDIPSIITVMDSLIQKAFFEDSDLTALFYQVKKLVELTPPQEKNDLRQVLDVVPYWAVRNLLTETLPLLEKRKKKHSATVGLIPLLSGTAHPPVIASPTKTEPLAGTSPSMLTGMFAALSRDRLKREIWVPSVPTILKLVWLVMNKELDENRSRNNKPGQLIVSNPSETIHLILNLIDRYTKPEERGNLEKYLEKLEDFERAGALSMCYLSLLASKTGMTVAAYLHQVKNASPASERKRTNTLPVGSLKMSIDDNDILKETVRKLSDISSSVLFKIARKLTHFHVDDDPSATSTCRIEKMSLEERARLINELAANPENYQPIIEKYLIA